MNLTRKITAAFLRTAIGFLRRLESVCRRVSSASKLTPKFRGGPMSGLVFAMSLAFILFAAAAIFIGVGQLRLAYVLQTAGVKAPAQVVNISSEVKVTRKDDGVYVETTYYTEEVAFSTNRGEMIAKLPEKSEHEKIRKVGDRLTVVYDPVNPSKVIDTTLRPLVSGLAALFFGAAFIIFISRILAGSAAALLAGGLAGKLVMASLVLAAAAAAVAAGRLQLDRIQLYLPSIPASTVHVDGSGARDAATLKPVTGRVRQDSLNRTLIERYEDGVKDGRSVAYVDGSPASFVTFVKGVKSGPFLFSDEYGRRYESGVYRNDKLDGSYVQYDPISGKAVLKGSYKNGLKVGIWRTYVNAEIVKEEVYEDGVLIKTNENPKRRR